MIHRHNIFYNSSNYPERHVSSGVVHFLQKLFFKIYKIPFNCVWSVKKNKINQTYQFEVFFFFFCLTSCFENKLFVKINIELLKQCYVFLWVGPMLIKAVLYFNMWRKKKWHAWMSWLLFVPFARLVLLNNGTIPSFLYVECLFHGQAAENYTLKSTSATHYY